MGYVRLVLLTCFLVTVGAISSPAAEQWYEIRSPHFVIITDGGEKRGREVALRFEQMRIAFGAIFQKLKVNVPIPVEVIAFRNNKELRRFCPLWKGKPVEMAGYFLGGEEKDFIALDLSAEAGWHVVYHEYTHLLMHANMSGMPVWFDEGFADYFSSLKMDSKHMEMGGFLEGHVQLLSQNRWIPVPALFSIRHDSPEYNEKGDHRSMFYAESWLVVHYLMGMKKMKEMSDYVDLVEQHVPVPVAIEKGFGMSPVQFERTLQNYLHHSLYFNLPAPPGSDNTSGYSSRAIGETDADAALADLHLHESDYQEVAIKEFEDVLAKQPDNAVAHRGLGYALLRKGDYAKAEEHFRKAVELNASDAQAHYFYALLILRRSGSVSGSDAASFYKIGSSDSSSMNMVKKEAEAAVALNGEYAEAYNLLAMADGQLGDYNAAIAAETRAIELDRHNEMYAMNLGQYAMAARRWSEAESVLRPLANSTNQMLAMTAQNHLQNIAVARRFEADPQKTVALTPQQIVDRRDMTRETSAPSSSPVVSPPAPIAVEFLKGKLAKVDCTADGGAALTISAGRITWTMTTADRKALVLIGTDNFSCDWHNLPVAVNYRKSGENQGTLLSLELQ